MKYITLNVNNPKVKPFYESSLKAFRKQFKDVATLSRLYVNKEGKVFAGEWQSANGTINFNGGYTIDAVKTIEFTFY